MGFFFNKKMHLILFADSIVPLLTGLSKNVCLRRLGLAWNGLIGEQFAKNLRKALAKNKLIEELNLEFNL